MYYFRHAKYYANKAGYTAQDAPSIRFFTLLGSAQYISYVPFLPFVSTLVTRVILFCNLHVHLLVPSSSHVNIFTVYNLRK